MAANTHGDGLLHPASAGRRRSHTLPPLVDPTAGLSQAHGSGTLPSPRLPTRSVSPSYQPGTPGPGGSGSARAHAPIRRRMRMITSCLECRRRKLKCNKKSPCENCEKFARDCVYLSSKLDEASQLRLTEIKEKVGSLERALERDVAKFGTPRIAKQQDFIVDDFDYDGMADEGDQWPMELTGVDVAYEDNVAEGLEDILDLGVRVGRMRITDRLGGLTRTPISDKMMAPFPPQARDAPERSHSMDSLVSTTSTWQGSISSDTYIPDFMEPGPSYIPPSSGLIIGQAMYPAPSFDMLLPTRAAADRLVEQYFRAVHPVARCLHKPSFESEYLAFWSEVSSSIEPRASTQALMFAVMFSAAASLDETIAVEGFGLDRKTLVNNLKVGVETALCKASFLRTTRVDTLQAFVVYLIPLCRAEISRGHSVLIGAAVRLAECIGLHRDGENFGLNPVETHVRRLLWHQLCFLDIKTAEAHGPRPFIRREDYDTKLPVNCEEEAIQAGLPPPEAEERWTTMLLPLIRFEINEMMRVIWSDRRRLETRKLQLTDVLAKTENFRKRMIEKYEGMLRDDHPTQRYTKLVMHLLLYRLYVMVLHTCHLNPTTQLPHRLNNVVVMAGIMIIEISIQLENDNLFRDWVWYFGAYVQYHIALLLASEMNLRPQNSESARIWACLDYVFNLEHSLAPEEKTLRIFDEISAKTAVYQTFRGLRRALPSVRERSMSHSTELMRRRGSHSPEGPTGDHARQKQHYLHPGYHSSGAVSASGSVSGSPQSVPKLLSAGYGVSSQASSAASDPGGLSPGGGSPLQGMIPQGNSGQGYQNMGSWLEGVDWEAVSAIFPTNPTTGEVNLAGYHDPSITIDWQQWR